MSHFFKDDSIFPEGPGKIGDSWFPVGKIGDSSFPVGEIGDSSFPVGKIGDSLFPNLCMYVQTSIYIEFYNRIVNN